MLSNREACMDILDKLRVRVNELYAKAQECENDQQGNMVLRSINQYIFDITMGASKLYNKSAYVDDDIKQTK